MPNNNVKPPAAPLVCIVDDDASMADSTRYLVRSFGFRAEAFLSAQEFLDSGLVEETRWLILILDLRMPGMDGLELQRNLASANQRIPIIFVSARASEDERIQAIAGGAVDFLRKPYGGTASSYASSGGKDNSTDCKQPSHLPGRLEETAFRIRYQIQMR